MRMTAMRDASRPRGGGVSSAGGFFVERVGWRAFAET